MVSFYQWQYILLLLLFYQREIYSVSATSRIRLLGLFQDDSNFSNPQAQSYQVRAMFKAAVRLSQKYNIRLGDQFIDWHIEETIDQFIDGMTSDVVGIVGPSSPREAHKTATFGEIIRIPVVSYSATDADLSNRNIYPVFYRTIPSDGSAALAIVHLFIRFHWTSCVIIYQNDLYGYSGMRTVNEAFVKNKFKVIEMIKFDIASQTIEGNLTEYLRKNGVRIVLLWAMPTYTSVILQQAVDHDVLGPRILWILSSNFSFDAFDKNSSSKLVGMLTVEPVSGSVIGAPINTSLLKTAYEVWQQYEPESFPGEDRVNQYALFAFDATWLLIQALQRLCDKTEERTPDPCITFINSSIFFDRRLVTAASFFDQITMTSFLGVTGLIKYLANGTDRSESIYYFARNVQSSSSGLHFVPVLQYDEQKSWEESRNPTTIIWPNRSCNVPNDQPVLSGVPLHIGIFELDPFAMTKTVQDKSGQSKTELFGYSFDLIEHLRERMNFIPRFSFPSQNTTYMDDLKALASGTYDILIGDVTITAERRDIVSFSVSIFDTSLSVVIKKPASSNVDYFSYMRPFSKELWITILATVIYASILMYLIERRHNPALRDRSIMSTSTMCVWYCIGTFMGYGVDYYTVTASGRLLTSALYMLSLILVATYTANLASSLTKSIPKYVVNGIDDIKNEKVRPNRIGLIKSTAMEEYYLREVSRENRNFYSGTSRQEILDKLLEGSIDATILDSSVAEYLTNNVYCNLTLVGNKFNDVAFGIAMRKNWPYAHELDMNILALREKGRLESLRKKWFVTGNCNTRDETVIAMGIQSMAGLFLIFGILTLLTLLPLISRKYPSIKNYFYTRKHRMNRVSHGQPEQSSQQI